MWLKIIIGAVLMTAFDLILDPGATALGFWVWEIQGWYYGVRVHEALGFSSFSISEVIDLLSGFVRLLKESTILPSRSIRYL